MPRLKPSKYTKWLLPLCAIAIACTIWQIQRYKTKHSYQQASVGYQHLSHMQASDNQKNFHQQATALSQAYPHTTYADLVAFQLTREAVQRQQWDKAGHYMQQVMRQGRTPIFRQLATLRYARILVEQQQPANALILLKKLEHSSLFALASLVKGDIYNLQNQKEKAEIAYKIALKYLPAHPLKQITQTKLSSIDYTPKLHNSHAQR